MTNICAFVHAVSIFFFQMRRSRQASYSTEGFNLAGDILQLISMQLSQIQNIHNPEGLDITARDVEILRGLFECRILTVEQIAALHFEDRQAAARKRIWKLKKADLVRERPRRAYEPAVLFLSRRALRLLIEQGHITDYPKLSVAAYEKRTRVSPLTLRHEIEVNDVKAAFAKAIRLTSGLQLPQFSTWPTLFQFWGYTRRGQRVRVQPDGFLRIRQGVEQHSFFLEVDRSSESHWRIAEKIECYLDFYRRGGLALRNGRPKHDYKGFPFRVLVVFRNAERRNNAAERLIGQQPPILSIAVLATIDEVRMNPLGPIWIRPCDYRDVVIGIPYGAAPLTSNAPIYRRSAERDEYIEKAVKRNALIDAMFDN
jgi:Replication-relaxation